MPSRGQLTGECDHPCWGIWRQKIGPGFPADPPHYDDRLPEQRVRPGLFCRSRATRRIGRLDGFADVGSAFPQTITNGRLLDVSWSLARSTDAPLNHPRWEPVAR